MFCPQCGNANDSAAKFCVRCGSALPEAAQAAPAAHAEIDAAGILEESYKAVVGPKNQAYYLRHFSRFDGQGKVGASWHWPALFVTFYWFLYRKMWLNALIYFFLPYLVFIPLGVVAALAGDSADIVVGIGYVVFLAGILLLPPLYANALYYKHCKKKISEVSASSHDLQRQLGELSGRGGTSNAALIVLLIFVFIAIIGILAAIAIPAYQDFSMRARMVEATTVGNNAAESVANYYYEHQQAPSSLAQAGFAAPLPPSVKEVGLDSESGVVTVTLAAGPVRDKSLLFVPSLDAKGQITWKCLSQDIPERYLPHQCRQQQ